MLTREMMKALEADGEYLTAMTGADHGPVFVFDYYCTDCEQETDLDKDRRCISCGSGRVMRVAAPVDPGNGGA